MRYYWEFTRERRTNSIEIYDRYEPGRSPIITINSNNTTLADTIITTLNINHKFADRNRTLDILTKSAQEMGLYDTN